MKSYKVAPFRKFSEGYTGQTKVAMRNKRKFKVKDVQMVRLHALTWPR